MIIIKILWRYFLNILIWLDIGINVIFFGGSPYETCSSRIGRHADNNEKWAIILSDILSFLLGENHCNRVRVPDYNDNLDEVR
jgi:hypothetical protein